MTAILGNLLNKKLATDHVVEWLTSKYPPDTLQPHISEYENLKAEFVPYFINFLRDQSVHLLNGSKSTNTTPAKTPLSAKFKRQLSKNNDNGEARSEHRKRHPSNNRVQLFGKYDNRFCDIRANGKEGRTYDVSIENIANNSYENTSFWKKHNRFVSPQPGSEVTPWSQRSIYFQDSHNQRSKNRHSFGDFITPDVEKRKTPNAQQSKRSGGRKSSDKKLFPSKAKRSTSPEFHLGNNDDFPTLGGGVNTSTPKTTEKERAAIPEGVKVITPSRRITPTLIRSSINPKPESPLAGSLSSWQSPSAGSGWKTQAPSPFCSTALTFQSPREQAQEKQHDSIEDERSFLKALKNGNVSLDSPNCWGLSPSGDQNTSTLVGPHNAAAARKTGDNDSDRKQRSGNRPRPRIPSSNALVDSSIPEKDEMKTATGDRVLGPLVSEVSTKQDEVQIADHCTLDSKTPVKMATHVTSYINDTSSLVTPTKTAATPGGLDRQDSSTEWVRAQPSEVSHREALDILAQLYSAFIEENLVPNLTVELYFVMQLLTSRGSELEMPVNEALQDFDEIQFFCSVHNAVYFAVQVLAKQKQILGLLDKGTLRLLVDNQRVADFNKDLSTDVTLIYESCPARVSTMLNSSPISGVSFQVETDNRLNFPNDNSFHVFRKQRDTFYELLRVWQERHLTRGWSLLETEGRRIAELVQQRTVLVNHIHLARLFQSQLLHTCKSDWGAAGGQGEEPSVDLLVQLRRTNPDKFKRLQERFITPSSVGGPCPAPTFPGCQEFFRDFLVAASCPQFYRHVADTMTAKISQLNATEFVRHENLEDGSKVGRENLTNCTAVVVTLLYCIVSKDYGGALEERESLANCLFALRLLGRFLGFVHFLPYQCAEALPSQVTNQYLANRNAVPPALDLITHVQTAQQCGRLVLTVPWVVEYLSMSDPLAPELSYVQRLLELLLRIYRFTRKHFQGSSHSQMLVILYLGWMFELQMFPEGLFFCEVEDDSDFKLPPDASLDTLGLVDQQLLYSCCPYLGEVRSVLVDFAVGSSSKGVSSSVRKITPVAAQSGAQEPLTLSKKQLQMQLEESFFHNHPASLKRTVEFVADRVASNHIKRFRNEALPVTLQELSAKAKNLARQALDKSPDKFKRSAGSIVQMSSTDAWRMVRNNDTQHAERYCSKKVKDILGAMLPEETSAHAQEICAQISLRLALEKVNTWMNTHITSSMFKREMTMEFEKSCKSLTAKLKKHEDTSITGAEDSLTCGLRSQDTSLEQSDCEASTKKSTTKETSKPTLCVGQDNELDKTKPHVNNCDTAVEEVKPHINTCDTAPEDVRPHINTCVTAPEDVRPHINTCETAPGDVRPTINACETAFGDVRPTINACETAFGDVRPTINACETAPGDARPTINACETAPGDVRPTINACETALESMREVNRLPSDILIEFKISAKTQNRSTCTSLKDTMSEIVLHNDVSPEQITTVIQCLNDFHCLACRQKDLLTIGVYRTVAKLTADLAYHFVLRHPAVWASSLQEVMLGLWNSTLLKYMDLSRVICPRHVIMLVNSRQNSFDSLKDFVMLLLKHNLVPVRALSAQCVSMVIEWLPTVTSQQTHQCDETLCHLLCNIITDYYQSLTSDKLASCEHFFDVIDAIYSYASRANKEFILSDVNRVMDKIRSQQAINSSPVKTNGQMEPGRDCDLKDDSGVCETMNLCAEDPISAVLKDLQNTQVT